MTVDNDYNEARSRKSNDDDAKGKTDNDAGGSNYDAGFNL